MALLNGTPGGKPASTNDDLVGTDDADNETMNGEGAQDDTEADSDDSEGSVLCTIMQNEDGGFTLVSGDEPDELDDMVAPEGASPAEGGTPALPKGKSYDNTREGQGQLLKAVLDLLRGSGDSDENAQADFESGFSEKPKA